jgi:hypothetical protein
VIGWLTLLASLLVEPAVAHPAHATDDGVCAAPVVHAEAASPPSLFAPPRPRGVTRVELVSRPFLGLVGNSWGQVGEARVEHHFHLPFMLGAELAPVAVASSGDGTGAVTHARVVAGYVSDHLTIGFGVGSRLQRFGTSGLSLAPQVRLGSLDGLNLSLSYTHTVARNKYSGRPSVGFANVVGKLSVPLARPLTLELSGGMSLDAWAYGTLGLRQRLVGDGGPGTWYVSGAFGVAMVIDRAQCNYDAVVPCTASASSYGPTLAVGVEHRF